MDAVNKYKGYIKCPFCGDKTFVMKNAHGKASHKCKCGKCLLFDYDSMQANQFAPLRGGAKYFNDRMNGNDRRLSR